MTQPPLGGISGTAKAVSNIRVTLVSSGQIGLHLKYAAQLGLHAVGVASVICVAPCDKGAIILHGGKSTTVPRPRDRHHQSADPSRCPSRRQNETAPT